MSFSEPRTALFFLTASVDCDDAAASSCVESSHAGDLSRNSCIMCLRLVTYPRPRSEAVTGGGEGSCFSGGGWKSERAFPEWEPLCCSASPRGLQNNADPFRETTPSEEEEAAERPMTSPRSANN